MMIENFHRPLQGAEPRHDPTPGIALLGVMTVAELSENASPAEMRGFALAIGRRFAALESLADDTCIAALSARINSFWRTLDWGEAEIVLENDGIIVRHRHAPREIPGGAHTNWPQILLAVLEGAYDSWFRQLGSGPSLKTVAEWKGDMVELRHGR
ncbi:MAG TPA: hypothetical protein VEZ26_06850 [Sphingomonadaceae bacterium]|nr:hypothetical protein [Sphingomonadaceae bacterium]